MASSSLYYSLQTRPKPRTGLDEVVLRHVVPGLVDRGLEVSYTIVRLSTGFSLHNALNGVVKGVAVW